MEVGDFASGIIIFGFYKNELYLIMIFLNWYYITFGLIQRFFPWHKVLVEAKKITPFVYRNSKKFKKNDLCIVIKVTYLYDK